ncbi:hypothetical protein B0J13DRAFT_648559 [Dactylonectria estremocensis]|uniref:Zn(2)-C6 fungal-type domain-containing protein n=1 Tax=Dactylonectria estremocensis TaxID=1079267 RepID=A0A9P9DJE4_9HYPO|nr:hypothetical protein B0J13DRAFT_648559 [Dactylonectria estremocensis]
MASGEVSGRIARISCNPCRKSKRRCDKKIPRCDLCTKKEIDCSYPLRHSAAKAQAALLAAANSVKGPDISSLERLSYSEVGQHSPVPFPSSAESDANATYFLAPRLFQQSNLQLPQSGLPHVDVSSLLGGASSVQNIAVKFFTTIHRWLPVISKQTFFSSLLNPIAQRRTEVRLLALCMKLCCTEPGDDDPRVGIYHIAKEFHHKAETYGPLSIQVLQAGILIAIYELGQSIYPAAYLNVGACARYGMALKIDHASVALGVDAESPRPWNETEERKRVWWAVLILDRYLSLSDPSRSLSSEDPTFESYLPVDDTAWDEGTAKPGDVVTMSTGFTLKTGNFARLAQATYLLSQALRLISETAVENDLAHSNQVMQLRRTIHSFVDAEDREVEVRRVEFWAQSELCLSTILLLQEHHLQRLRSDISRDGTQTLQEGLWSEARTALDRLSMVAEFYNTACPETEGSNEFVPIFLIQAMYQAASLLLTMSKASQDEETIPRLETAKQILRLIKRRWRLAGVYLHILETQEKTASLEAMAKLPNIIPIHARRLLSIDPQLASPAD